MDDLREVIVDCNIFLFIVSSNLSEPNNGILVKMSLWNFKIDGFKEIFSFVIAKMATQEETFGGFFFRTTVTHCYYSVSKIVSKFAFI